MSRRLKLSPTSVYRLLHAECHRLFPDDMFADLFEEVGRRSVPPRIVSVVMVLQRLEGLSDREAVERFAFDVRWKYAAGGLDIEGPTFVHTVLVDMRARLRGSKDRDRIFNAVLDVAKEAGMVGRKRVLDSTPLYDAVATQDTVTMIRSAIRGVLRVADEGLGREVRAVLKRDEDYATAGKPACDWDDKAAREALIDALARDAHAVLVLLHGRTLADDVREAAGLLATVVGQDLEQTKDGCFRIAHRVAPDRVISTVDPETRHGHKTSARGFDGYKGHIAMDPDSEFITCAGVTAGNVGDAAVAKELLDDVIPLTPTTPSIVESAPVRDVEAATTPAPPAEVFGDASYGTGEMLEHLEKAGATANVKVQPASAPGGRFTKDAFQIDLEKDTVTCPAGRLGQIRRREDGTGIASFGAACETCPMAAQCTASAAGRVVNVSVHERHLRAARTRQRDPAWGKVYRATRPKVERKLAHLVRRKHGGRRARVRGLERVGQDFGMLCAAANLNRLAALGWRRPVPTHATPRP
jgi:hypothetical protein